MTINGLRWTPIICMTGCLWVLESWDSPPWFVASSGFVIKSARQLLLSLDEVREHWKFTPRITLVVTQLLKLFYTSYTCTILDGAKVSWVWHYPLSDLLVGTKLQGVDWCLQLSTGDIMQLCSVFKTKGHHLIVYQSCHLSSTQSPKREIAVLHFPLAHASHAIRVSPSIPLHTGYPLLFIQCFLKCHESCAPSGHLQLKKK